MPKKRGSGRRRGVASAVRPIRSLADVLPDPLNANAGTQRGRAMVETSVRRYGAGRSLLVDKHGVLIAGEKTKLALESAGLTDAIVVQTDGSRPVVVQRTDLDLRKGSKARELGIADNQASSVGLSWHRGNLEQMAGDGVDMKQFFREPEWKAILKQTADVLDGQEIPEMALQPFEEYNYLVVVFKNSQDWQGACDTLGVRREVAKLGGVRKVGVGRVLDGGALLERLRGGKKKAS